MKPVLEFTDFLGSLLQAPKQPAKGGIAKEDERLATVRQKLSGISAPTRTLVENALIDVRTTFLELSTYLDDPKAKPNAAQNRLNCVDECKSLLREIELRKTDLVKSRKIAKKLEEDCKRLDEGISWDVKTRELQDEKSALESQIKSLKNTKGTHAKSPQGTMQKLEEELSKLKGNQKRISSQLSTLRSELKAFQSEEVLLDEEIFKLSTKTEEMQTSHDSEIKSLLDQSQNLKTSTPKKPDPVSRIRETETTPKKSPPVSTPSELTTSSSPASASKAAVTVPASKAAVTVPKRAAFPLIDPETKVESRILRCCVCGRRSPLCVMLYCLHHICESCVMSAYEASATAAERGPFEYSQCPECTASVSSFEGESFSFDVRYDNLMNPTIPSFNFYRGGVPKSVKRTIMSKTPKNGPTWKTEFCQDYANGGCDVRKEDCPYAHGARDLRKV